MCLIAVYCIYFGTEQMINHLHEQNMEMVDFVDEIPDQYYYFQDEHGEMDLHAPIFMSLKE
jgi:hypothetical protein